MIGVVPIGFTGLTINVSGQLTQRQTGANCFSQLQSETHVLVIKSQLEVGVVVAVQNGWAVLVRDVAGGSAVLNNVLHLVRIHAPFYTEHQRFRQSQRVHVAEHNLRDLGGIASAGATEMLDTLTDDIEDCFALGEH